MISQRARLANVLLTICCKNTFATLRNGSIIGHWMSAREYYNSRHHNRNNEKPRPGNPT
jgi:hypothetical protein